MSTEYVKNWLWAINVADVRSNRSVQPLGGDLDADNVLNVRVMNTAINSGSAPKRMQVVSDQDDLPPAGADSELLCASRAQLYDGATDTYLRQRAVSGSDQREEVASGVAVTLAKAGTPRHHAPAVGVQATVTAAAPGAGASHVVTGIQASLATGAAASGVSRVQLLSAGVVIWEHMLQVAANASIDVSLTGLNIACGNNEAVTLQFSAAPVGTAFQAVNLQSYIAA